MGASWAGGAGCSFMWACGMLTSTVVQYLRSTSHMQILTGQCILVTYLRYVHKEITRFQIQFCGNHSWSPLQVAVERPPVLEVAKPPQRRRARNLHAKEAKWAPLPAPDQVEPPESEAIFPLAFRWQVWAHSCVSKKKLEAALQEMNSEKQNCWGMDQVLHDFSTTPRDPQVVNGMSIAELIYWKLRAWAPFWAEFFVCRIPKWQLLRWMLQWATFQDSSRSRRSRSITKGFAVKVMEGTLFYAKESVLYFKLMI